MATLNPTNLIIFVRAGLYQAAWQALLTGQPGLAMGGTVGDEQDVEKLLCPGQANALLVDGPTLDVRLAEALQMAAPTAGLLFLVDAYDLEAILPLLRAGVHGCLSRQATVGELARALIAVGRQEIVLPPEVAGRALAALARGESPGSPLIEPLSDREEAVLKLLAQGLTNKDMGQTLILSVRTVEAHLRNIYGKLAVHSRTEAVLWAVQHGYGRQP
jgi:NarL family two-component system response regulator LiaR